MTSPQGIPPRTNIVRASVSTPAIVSPTVGVEGSRSRPTTTNGRNNMLPANARNLNIKRKPLSDLNTNECSAGAPRPSRNLPPRRATCPAPGTAKKPAADMTLSPRSPCERFSLPPKRKERSIAGGIESPAMCRSQTERREGKARWNGERRFSLRSPSVYRGSSAACGTEAGGEVIIRAFSSLNSQARNKLY